MIARYALSDQTEVLLTLPYKSLTLRVDNEDEHHRNETLDGIGDVRLGIRHFFFYDRSLQISGLLGASLPMGALNEITAASYLRHDEAASIGVDVPEHSHLQLGTGTIDPFVGIEILHRSDTRWMLYGSINIDLPFYENRYGYRTSPAGTLNFGPARYLRSTKVIASFFVEVFHANRDRLEAADVIGPGGAFDGRMGVPNTGRLEMAFKPGITWSMTENLTLNFQARFPVYTRIQQDREQSDVQLTEPAGLIFSLSYNL